MTEFTVDDGGLTNMAQAMLQAENLLTTHGRREAQSAIMIISDGEATQKEDVKDISAKLDEKGIMKYMVIIQDAETSDAFEFAAKVATDNDPTNIVWVPGFGSLQGDASQLVVKAITKFCPASISAKRTEETSQKLHFQLVKQGGYCGALGRVLNEHDMNGNPVKITDSSVCKDLAEKAGATGFSLSHYPTEGSCAIEKLEFTCDEYKAWLKAPEKPKCKWGHFIDSDPWDWYAIQPTNCSDLELE